MAKKNLDLTFAQKAQEIIKRYKRFMGDPISEKSMELELAELAKEQELLKQKMQQQDGGQPAQPVSSQPQQPRQFFLGGLTGALNTMTNPLNNLETNPFSLGNQLLAGSANAHTFTGQTFENLTSEPISTQQNVGNSVVPATSETTIPSTQSERPAPLDVTYMPSRGISQITSSSTQGTLQIPKTSEWWEGLEPPKVGYAGMLGVAGNAYDLIDALGSSPQQVNFNRVNPELIDSSEQEKLISDTYNEAFDSAAYVGRQTAQSAGQRLGNRSALESMRGRRISGALAEIRERTENANTQTRNQFALHNSQIDQAEQDWNARAKEMHRARISNNLNVLGQSFASRQSEQRMAERDYWDRIMGYTAAKETFKDANLDIFRKFLEKSYGK